MSENQDGSGRKTKAYRGNYHQRGDGTLVPDADGDRALYESARKQLKISFKKYSTAFTS